MLTLLIDADPIAYRFAFAAQTTTQWDDETSSTRLKRSKEDVAEEIDEYIDDLMYRQKADKAILCLSCATVDGFRYKLWNGYKQNRKQPKPILLPFARDHIRKKYATYERPLLEADDILGILGTHRSLIKGEKIIVSIDKDLRTVPGQYWNPDRPCSVEYISEAEADTNHLRQALIGDSTDGYPGCPGVGPKKVDAILWGEDRMAEGTRAAQWKRIVAAFEKKGLTEDDALLQARLARILRAEDYDFKRKEVKLWQPPK